MILALLTLEVQVSIWMESIPNIFVGGKQNDLIELSYLLTLRTIERLVLILVAKSVRP